MYNDINIEKQRRDLIDYFGSAINCGYPQLIIEISNIENMTNEELINYAINNGFDINDYVIGKSLYL